MIVHERISSCRSSGPPMLGTRNPDLTVGATTYRPFGPGLLQTADCTNFFNSSRPDRRQVEIADWCISHDGFCSARGRTGDRSKSRTGASVTMDSVARGASPETGRNRGLAPQSRWIL